ncbi:MAG: type II toxin-antitoxin system RelE/ParE family toxin [Bacteroidales bacterium]|jgi:plasmid stabilization system protein ParE|nr:type II toxin-antitoxin system RelE/ParE family toxin [Bacteroidales bacterium]
MAKREIIWTRISEIQIQEILEFFSKRNKSGEYSRKLYKKFKTELKTVAKRPELGIKTRLDQIRGLIIEDYIIFYEILEDSILILKVWDCRQNPDKLSIPR